MAKQKADDIIDVTDLAKVLKSVISKSFQDGAEEAFSGKSFISDLNNQMKEYTKEQNAQRFNDVVRKKALDQQISTEQAEIDVLALIAKQKNNSLIADLQQNAALVEKLMLNAELMGNMKAFYGFQEKLTKLQADMTGLQVENALIDKTAKMRKEQLATTEKQAKLDKEANRIKEKIEEATEWQHKFKKVTENVIDVLKTPELSKAIFLEQMGERIEHVNHAMHELVDTGMSAGEAINLMREDFSLMSAMGLSKVADVSKDLVANFGTAKVLTEAQRAAVGEMATSYGLAGEEAAGLTMALSRMPGESKDSATNFAKSAESIGKMKGVLPSQVMKEMAKNAGLMATFSQGGATGFANAAAAAKKMGVELGSVAASAEKLLDFESSINAQMQASVLIGKDLNFDKMREASLAGDLNAVMEEQAKIMSEVGSLDQMNVLQKKALADAMGVTTEELVKMSEAQKFSNQYFGENSTALDNAIGKTMKYGGAVAGFVKENGMMLITGAQTIIQLMTLNALRAQSTGLSNLGIISFIKETAAKVANTAATAANTVARWLGIGAKGAESAANSALSASNAAVAATSGPAAAGIGVTASAAAIAIIPLLGLAAAAIGFGFALKLAAPTIVGVATVIGNVLIKALEMLPGIITSVADGFTKMFSAVSENIGTLLLLGPALMMIGTGLAFMGTAGLVALPVITALTALGAVGAALGSLGVIGGEGGAGDGGGMKELINEVKGLKLAMLTPVIVNLDGRKVAEGTRQATNYGAK